MVSRILATLAVLFVCCQPDAAWAQRFGGQFGGAAGFWLQYMIPNIDTRSTFGRDLGDLVLVGGRGFIQTGRVRLGFGAFGGSFTDEGVNSAGNEVSGGLNAAGLTAEYLIVQKELELIVGGFIGGGTLNVEELLSVTGEVETINRVKESLVIGIPWVRAGYNIAPLVNVGVEVGYMVGTQGFDGLTIGLDILAGLIP